MKRKKRSEILKILLMEFPGDHNRCNQVLDLCEPIWKTSPYVDYWKEVHPRLIRLALTFG